jgi:transposase
MEQITRQCVGIDVSKDEFAVTFSVCKPDLEIIHLGFRKFKNNDLGFKAFNKWVGKFDKVSLPLKYVMEATGVYHERLACFLYDLGKQVSVVLPKRAKDFSKTLKVKTITDKIASEYLAVMGLEKKLDVWSKPERVYAELRKLTREREQLQDHITQVKNEIHAEKAGAWGNPRTIKRYQQHLKLLKAQIKEIEVDIDDILNKHPKLKEKVRKITTVPGLGKLTVVTIIGETHGFHQVKNKRQLVSYAGYDVISHDSGTSIKTKPRISKRGNRHIRKAMHMPALTSIRHNTLSKEQFIRIVSKSGIKMKGVVAIQRKLLVLTYTLWKNETEYDADFEQKEKGQLSATLNELDQVRSL